MEMVQFLVEEVGCDVNGTDVPEGLMPGNHFGTPLNYAAHTGGGEGVVRYLLDVSLRSLFLPLRVGFQNVSGHMNGLAIRGRYLTDRAMADLDVVIQKGADPGRKDCYGMGDAFTYAKGNREYFLAICFCPLAASGETLSHYFVIGRRTLFLGAYFVLRWSSEFPVYMEE